MLKPYNTYKKTKYDWLPKIPSTWKQRTLRSMTKISEKRNKDRTDLELLSVYRDYGVIRKSSRTDNHNVESLDLSNYKYVSNGYLVMNKMKMWQGSLGISAYEGIVSPAYIVCQITESLNSQYLHMLLRSPAFKTFYNSISYGVRVGQWDMRYNDFKQLEIYLPPKTEQDQIVRYLDWQTTKINKLINAKKKQIALLKEQKQAVINQAVTKGLDPNAEMKDSGVPWLGDIPKHWEVRKLRTLTRTPFQYGANESGVPHTDANPRYIRITDITSDGSLKNSGKLSLLDSIATPYILDDGDILFARSGGTVGKSFIFMSEYGCSAFAGYLIRFKPNTDVLIPNYIYNFTLGLGYKIWLSQVFIQATIQNISAEKYKNLQIPLPPLNEQVDINNYVKLKSEIYNKTIKIIEQEIELANEYKIRLISDVVTGQVDVRDIVVPVFVEEDVIEDMEEQNELDEVEEETVHVK